MHACTQTVLGICVLYCAFAVFFVGDGSGSMKEADIPLLLVGYGFGASFVALFAQVHASANPTHHTHSSLPAVVIGSGSARPFCAHLWHQVPLSKCACAHVIHGIGPEG